MECALQKVEKSGMLRPETFGSCLRLPSNLSSWTSGDFSRKSLLITRQHKHEGKPSQTKCFHHGSRCIEQNARYETVRYSCSCFIRGRGVRSRRLESESLQPTINSWKWILKLSPRVTNLAEQVEMLKAKVEAAKQISDNTMKEPRKLQQICVSSMLELSS